MAPGARSDLASGDNASPSRPRPDVRFAYIDSQGNEVDIPSVDALRLRIELGAIVDETVFLDAQTGKWAAAGEHEIFRTLQRELRDLETGGFVPPPQIPERKAEAAEAPPAEAEPVEESVVPEPDAASVEESVDIEPVAASVEGSADPEPVAAFAEESFDPDPFTVSAESDPGQATSPHAAAESSDSDSGDRVPDEGFGFGIDLDVSSEFGEEAAPEPPQAANEALAVPVQESPEVEHDPAPEVTEEGAAPVEDLQTGHPRMEGLETGSSLPSIWDDDDGDQEGHEGGFASVEAHDADHPSGVDAQGGGIAPMETLGNLHPEFVAEVPVEESHDPAPQGDPGLELEPSLSEGYVEEPAPSAPAMNFETPRSDFDEEEPPAWMTPGSPDDEFGEAPPESWEGEGDAELDVDVQEPPTRPRTAPPQRKLTRAGTPGAGQVAGLIIAAVVLGVGGWYSWNRFVTGGIGAGAPVEVFNLPDIPQELVPQMRQLSAAAVGSMVQELGGLPERDALPAAPDREWLAGRYLAGASGFPSVPEYWRGVLSYVSSAESAQDEAFRVALDARIADANLAEADAGLIHRRAVAGWEAAESERELVYRQMRSVATAALELHQFLVGNQDQITYEPAAAGVSRDPVLEAVPSSEALGAAMWERVAAITEGLDNLGFLNTITTDGLVETFLEKLASTPIR